MLFRSALAYTPGVAEPCKVIAKDPEAAYLYTIKSNTIAVVSDGSAVLGLGNIGPLAAMPVMEGTVSYTHLDVYKRQPPGWFLGDVPGNRLRVRAPACVSWNPGV